MAFDEYDDYEQSERVQKWLRENGISIVVGVVIGLVAIFGWQQWRHHQARNEAAASQLYQQAHAAFDASKPNEAASFVDALIKDYPKSSYAVFAVSERASQEVQAGKLDKAETSLQWAEKHAQPAALKGLIELRLARVQMARSSGKNALDTLARIPTGDYSGMAEELRGDALVKLGRSNDARKAYQAALSALNPRAPQRGPLQMKLDDLAVAGKQGA